jgi:rSAM/selenodomain-associated transferase 1
MKPARHLVIMAKQPRLGRVKTRLGREIGAVEATRVYRLMLNRLLRRLGHDARWQTWLAVDGVHEVNAPVWPGGVHVVNQGQGSLGQRMQRQFDTLPPGPVALIGSDIPEITPADVAVAFKLLGEREFCFGPAPDGGYWLVGQAARSRRTPMFVNVRWSSEYALADTLANVQGRSIGKLRQLTDVDDAASYRDFMESGYAFPGKVETGFPSGTAQKIMHPAGS